MHSARVIQNVLLCSSHIANCAAGLCRHIIPEGSGILARLQSMRRSARAYHRARALCYGTQTYGTSDPGGPRARGRARARAERPTWAYRVWYRELGPIGMFRRKWQSATCPRKIPVKHTDRLEELTDLELYLTTPDHP